MKNMERAVKMDKGMGNLLCPKSRGQKKTAAHPNTDTSIKIPLHTEHDEHETVRPSAFKPA